MKIQVILEGGLGNQMFQYAIGRSLSLHYGSDTSYYTPSIYGHQVKREFQLNYFGIEGTDKIIENPQLISEFSLPIDSLYNLSNNNYVLRGYWQDENYFEPYKEQIRKDFSIGVTPIEGRLLVQVRRTDYLNNPYHEYCNLEWYKNAISEMQFNEVVFVSDDIDWCKENFDYINLPKTFIEGNEIDQFRAMYSCDRFVISNSSFGWWGAWWTDSNNVICPKIWIPGNESLDPARPNWKKM
jgi:hypothetical protein